MAISTSTMKSFMDVLAQYKNDTTTSGIAILDHAVRAVSGFNSLQDAIDAFVDEVTDEGKGDVDERLLETCGIILGDDNDFDVDTGAVSGSNAGNKDTKNAADIVPEDKDSSLKDLSMPAAGSRTEHYYIADGKKHVFYIQWPASFTQVVDRKWQTEKTYDPKQWGIIDLKNQTTEKYYLEDPKTKKEPDYYEARDLKKSIETITKGMEHWWAAQSAQLIYDSFGVDFEGKTLKVDFLVNQYDLQADTAPAGKEDNDTTPTDEIFMSIGLPLYGKIDESDVNGDTRKDKDGTNQCYLDRTIAHEMVHAVMCGNGTFKRYNEKNSKVASMPQFFTEGIAELIMGLDDFDANNKKRIVELAGDSQKLSAALSMEGGTGDAPCYTAGYMFLRYLCKQGLNNPSAVADVIGIEEYYDKDGKKLEEAQKAQAVITINGDVDPKTVTVTNALENTDVRIDLSDANVDIKDDTGEVVFTLNGSLISGRGFSVQENVVLETGDVLTVNEGDITTSDSDGIFTVKKESFITTTGDGKITINEVPLILKGSRNGVTYLADEGMSVEIQKLDAGESVTYDIPFENGEVKVDGTVFTAIYADNGIVFSKPGTAVEAELDQKGDTVTVGGFTFTAENISRSVSVFVDDGGSHVAGLANGNKVTVTNEDGLTTTYTADGSTLVIEYTDSSSKTTTKSYSLGDWDNFTATWDGTSDPVAGKSIKPGTVTIGGKNLNSVVEGALIDAQGYVTTDGSKAVATIETKGDSLNYKATDTSKTQEIGIYDTDGLDWNIDTSAAKGRTFVDAGVTRDEDGRIEEANPVNNAVNVTTGSGRSEVAVCSNADSSIKGGSGSLIATVGGKGNHHVTAGSGSRNEIYDFGTGDNVLAGGSGQNTFESENENGKLVAGSGKNIFKTVKNVTNKVEGFTYGRDQISLGAAVTDYTKFNVGEGTINYGGKAANGEVDVSNGTGTGNAYMVTMVDSTGHKTRVGWTGEDGGTVDASSETKPFVLIGDRNKDAKDILIGGTGNDVIYAGENDIVRGGAGRNQIHLLGGSCRTVEFGAAGAKDEVAGFMPGFDVDDADSIYLMDSSVTDSLDLRFDGKDAVLKSGSTKMAVNSVQKNGKTNAAELLIGGVKVAAIAKGTTATISEADYADVYFATGSASLDFKDVYDDLTVDLSDESRFRNIKTVKGGKDNTVLMGGSGKTTLVSGGGDTSLWGGSGNALLVGAKDARDEFFFFGESGRDTISGFEAGTGDTSDVLNIFGSDITNIKGKESGVEIYTSDSSRLRIQGLKANDKLQWVSGDSKGVAKIGSSSQANTFNYDDEVTNYFGGSKKDTLKVSGDSHSVWMENLGSSIDIIDASNATGDNILAGGREAETIIGGRGDNSLWGGAGGNDVLQGGSGYNEFYFGKGEGKDTIIKSSDSDKVMLYNVKLEDVNGQATGLKNGNMVIALNDGSSLTLKNYGSNGATTFQLADGTFSYDRNTGSWQERK